MADNDQEFMIQRNIQRYSRLLESERDQIRRATLKNLLREERSKYAGILCPAEPSQKSTAHSASD